MKRKILERLRRVKRRLRARFSTVWLVLGGGGVAFYMGALLSGERVFSLVSSSLLALFWLLKLLPFRRERVEVKAFDLLMLSFCLMGIVIHFT